MQMPKKFRVAAASGLLLVTATALLLEHLRLINWEWSQGMVLFSTLAAGAVAAYFEYRST
jgi:hypothetical protein